MLAYISVILLVFFLFIASISFPFLSKINSYFVLIYISVLSGLRYGVGVDYFNYQLFIEKIALGADTYMEPGFEVLSFYITSAGASPQFIFLFFSFFTCLFYIVSINRCSIDKAMSLALFCFIPFFYLASFNQVRQFFVASLLAFSIGYIIKRRLIFFILIVSFAFTFHKIAVLFLPMYWFSNKLWSVKSYFVFLGLFIVICNFIDYFAMFIGISAAYFVEEGEGAGVFDYRVLVFLLLFVMSYIAQHRLVLFCSCSKKKFQHQSIVVAINMAFVCILIMVSPVFIHSINSSELLRLSGLFSFSLLILIPFIIDRFIKRYALIFSVGGVLLSILYFLITIIINGAKYKLVPYDGSLLLFS